jgi:hypothetical protein
MNPEGRIGGSTKMKRFGLGGKSLKINADAANKT